MKRRVILLFSILLILLSSFVSAATVYYWEGSVMDTKSWSCGAGSTDSQIYFDSTSWCRSYWQIQGIPTNMTNVHSAVLQFEYNSGSGGQSATTTVYNLSASQMETGSWSLATATCGNTKESLTGSCANNPSIRTLSLTGSASSGNPDELNLTNYFNSRISSGVTLDTNMTHTWDSGTIANNYNGGSTGTIKIYYTSNSPPNTPSPTLVSVDGTNNTNADLNCSSTIIDPEGDSMNVSVEWFRNTTLYDTYSLNNNYANGTTVSHILSSGNLSINDSWICSMQTTDGSATSDWGNSTALKVIYDAYWTWTNITLSTNSGVRGEQFTVQVDVTCSSGTSDCDGNAGTIHLDPKVFDNKVVTSDPWMQEEYWYVELI